MARGGKAPLGSVKNTKAVERLGRGKKSGDECSSNIIVICIRGYNGLAPNRLRTTIFQVLCNVLLNVAHNQSKNLKKPQESTYCCYLEKNGVF